jgi:cob(I)alamin adenosyltransferase
MYNRRVSKAHPRVASYGAVDELNAALGLARAQARGARWQRLILGLQRDLVVLMGELATDPRDARRFAADGFATVNPKLTAKLDDLAKELEAKQGAFKDWVMPGGSPCGAALDLARTICRRAERSVVGFQESSEQGNPELTVYLNRLADVLWLLAREVERPRKRRTARA